MSDDINKSKLVGGKRKNGHKSNCTCHICENMENKAKRGGYKEEIEKKKEFIAGGLNKKNGHRKACECPICKNMKNSKKRGCSKYRNTKRRTGGDDDETDTSNDETDTSNEEDALGEDAFGEKEQHEQKDIEEDKNGGRRKNKSNGHKEYCKCPICKNMRKKKGGNNNKQPDEENQIGDVEEAGINATRDSNLQDNETKASTSDYDALEAAEKGEVGQNILGGTRKKRRICKNKWRGKTRKSRRTRRHD
jgi:hypothetical protein